MKRPELKDYQTKAFHHFDMDAYAKDLDKYIDYLESKAERIEDEKAFCSFCKKEYRIDQILTGGICFKCQTKPEIFIAK